MAVSKSKPSKTPKSDYSAQQIQVLEGFRPAYAADLDPHQNLSFPDCAKIL